MVTLTPTRLADAPLLAALHQDAFGVAAWPEPMLAESLRQESVWGLQLQVADTVVGFVLCQQVAEDCEILTIAVAPSQQRRGYGRALLQAVYDTAKTQSSPRIFLEVAADNHPAAALYTAFGFRQTGKRPAYYPRPTGAVAAVLMQFDL